MENVKVVFKSYHKPEIIARGYWDQAILEDTFKKPAPWHWQKMDEYFKPDVNEGAVIIINGRTHVEDVEQINQDIQQYRWVVIIITGDEEALFPWQELKHPLKRVWVQLPRMNVHNDVNYRLPNGYRTDTPKLLGELGYQEKSLDWCFIGQVNHARREQCVHELRLLDEAEDQPNGRLLTTDGFGKEVVSQKEYLMLLACSKIVLCPSGIETPDSFRLYEALEAGCLPVVDAFATRNQSFGFWQYLFGDELPFPVVDYWDKLPALLPELLRDYPHNANKAFAWWQLKKRELHNKLIDDIREVSR